MPKKLHRKLAKAARKKGLKGKQADRYIYGTMKKIDKGFYGHYSVEGFGKDAFYGDCK